MEKMVSILGGTFCVSMKWMIHKVLSWSRVRRERKIGDFSFKYSVGSGLSSSGWGMGGF